MTPAVAPVLEHAMRCALDDIRRHPTGVALLGIEADESDPELGYIVSAAHDACRLIREGALWNSFILACRARSLIELSQRCPDVVQMFEAVGVHDEARLRELYHSPPEVDFSRHVATGQETPAGCDAVPRCGRSDLGTPYRLAQTLARWPKQRWRRARRIEPISMAGSTWLSGSLRCIRHCCRRHDARRGHFVMLFPSREEDFAIPR